jgi:shikimate dehydrogenase
MTDNGRRSVLVGLIGRGIGASLSPRLHEREAAAQGLSLVYRPVDFAALGLGSDDLERVLEAARLLGFDGFNVTHPYKTAVLSHLSELSREAEAIGAVNTVLLREQQRIGHNTDWYGFAEGLRRGVPLKAIRRVTQLGAGGAGLATAFALLQLGAQELTVVDVDRARAEQLVARFAARYPDRAIVVEQDAGAALTRSDGLVQATPVGMVGHPGLPLDPGLLRADQWVAEVIYTPRETELLRQARRLGCPTVDGSHMVLFQAARAFEMFTGRAPDLARMRACLDEASESGGAPETAIS